MTRKNFASRQRFGSQLVLQKCPGTRIFISDPTLKLTTGTLLYLFYSWYEYQDQRTSINWPLFNDLRSFGKLKVSNMSKRWQTMAL